MSYRQTHCSRGHEFRVVGQYTNGRCRACARKNARIRKRKLSEQKRLAKQRRSELGSPRKAGGQVSVDERTKTALLLTLYDRKERAATWWDRERIQAQIDEVKRS